MKKISERKVGGKAWNLFRLLHYGFRVPSFCVVSSSVFDEVVGAHGGEIDDVLSGIDFTDRSEVERAALGIESVVSGVEFPGWFSRELRAAVRTMFEKDALLSVRSSVIGEDSRENSFAGQMDSFLNVSVSMLALTIRKVWASAFSSRALLYRNRKGIGLKDVTTAVILQEMLQSETSGVMFTRDTEKGKPECVISAGFGLGEGVVTNSVETDTYRIGWREDDVSKDVRWKDCRVVLGDTEGNVNRKERLPEEMRFRQVLEDEKIRELRDLGVAVERRFKLPQDIEWAFHADGGLWVLQSRPVVLPGGKRPVDTVRVWDNSNIVESYPGLTLPLTFSFARAGYERAFRGSSEGMVFFKKAIRKRQDLFGNMIGLLNGRVYYNLLNWYEMLSYLPGFKKHKESWDQMIGISREMSFPKSKLSLVNSLCSSLMILTKLLSVVGISKRFFRHFDKHYRRIRSVDVSSATEHELIAVYEGEGKELSRKWHLAIYNDLCAMKYYGWLKKLCGRWGLEEEANIHNNLLCGEHGVESIAPVRSLIALAGKAREEPYRTLMRDDDSDRIWKTMQEEPAYSGMKEAIDFHLHEYGDRSLEELKLESRSFREDPAALIRLIKRYSGLTLSVDSMEGKELGIRRSAEEAARKHLKGPFRRMVFGFVLRNARRAIANRENMRFARTRIFGIARRLFRRMADLLVEKGLLESCSDIHYLTVEELFGYVLGTSATLNLKRLVELRKSEYAAFGPNALEERIETTGIPYLGIGFERAPEGVRNNVLRGIPCSSGGAEGAAKVVIDPRSADGGGSYVLVARSTDPGWVFLMLMSKGIVVERGSVLSHTAIIGRELGIPTIVGVKGVTRIIPDGAFMTINGGTGEIRWR